MDFEAENPKNDRETEGKIGWRKKDESKVQKEMKTQRKLKK